MDNRPLRYEEYETLLHQTIYMSATPGDFELQKTGGVIVDQVIRPTGLLDPQIFVRPSLNQIDDLMHEIDLRVQKNERTLVTTLTKRMAEELTKYLADLKIKTRYIHSDIDTMERVEILGFLRSGEIDVLVGVNLLREGLDLPEVSLVAILDADKEGFLRSEKSLTQTAGRAARNVNGMVIMYADRITGSMERTINETNRRREKQTAYNIANNITPTQIKKAASEGLGQSSEHGSAKAVPYAYVESDSNLVAADPIVQHMKPEALKKAIENTKAAMKKAAKDLDFIEAARLRDEMFALEKLLKND